MDTETVFRRIQNDPELWAKWNEAHFDEQRTALLVKVAYDLGRAVFEDPILVQVVEELGDEANGMCSKLMIEELPKGTLYRIEEYDGMETIETSHEVEWKVA